MIKRAEQSEYIIPMKNMVDFSQKIHLIGNLETEVMLGVHQNHTKSRLKMIGDTQYTGIDALEIVSRVENI